MQRESTTDVKGSSISKAMTIGQLARRSGVSIRALREYEGTGLIYGLGRSDSNYRLFDESALWCLQVIGRLRALGLTLKEIQQISAVYCEQRGDPIGPRLREKLDLALERIEPRMTELKEVRHRIRRFQAAHATSLAGRAELELYAADPRRQPLEAAS